MKKIHEHKSHTKHFPKWCALKERHEKPLNAEH